MAMTKDAAAAFGELKSLGADVWPWIDDDGDEFAGLRAFCMSSTTCGWEEDPSRIFLSMWGELFRGDWSGGRYETIAAFRLDVHEILKKYKLVTDWETSETLIVYNDPDAPGFSHAKE